MKGIQNLKISEELENAILSTGINQNIQSVFKRLYDQGFHPIAIEHVLANEVHNSGAELRLMEGSKQVKSLKLEKDDNFHVRPAATNPVITELLRNEINDKWINDNCNTNIKININEIGDWDTDCIIGNVFNNLVIHILISRGGLIRYYIVNRLNKDNTKDLTDFDGNSAIESELLFDDNFVPLFVDRSTNIIYPYKQIYKQNVLDIRDQLIKLEPILSDLAVDTSDCFY